MAQETHDSPPRERIGQDRLEKLDKHASTAASEIAAPYETVFVLTVSADSCEYSPPESISEQSNDGNEKQRRTVLLKIIVVHRGPATCKSIGHNRLPLVRELPPLQVPRRPEGPHEVRMSSGGSRK
jgi:hypothetical protein